MSVTLRQHSRHLSIALAAAALAACSRVDSPTGTSAAYRPRLATTPAAHQPVGETITVCKVYAAGATSTPDIVATVYDASSAQVAQGTVAAGTCVDVFTVRGSPVVGNYTVTETVPGPQTYTTTYETYVGPRNAHVGPSGSGTTAPAEAGGSADNLGGTGTVVVFTNTQNPPPEVTGSQGCTPGYWKQSQHFGSWNATAYHRSDLVNTVFGITFSPKVPKGQGTFDGTLLGALGLGGGGDIALVRAGTAALLNASSTDVAYPYTSAQVIKTVQDALAAGGNAIGTAANLLDSANNLGCPLGRNP